MTECVRKSICDSPLKYERSYINPRSINISSHETMLRRETRSDCQNHNLHLESHFQHLAFFSFCFFVFRFCFRDTDNSQTNRGKEKFIFIVP